jgi:hypothetical protein
MMQAQSAGGAREMMFPLPNRMNFRLSTIQAIKASAVTSRGAGCYDSSS